MKAADVILFVVDTAVGITDEDDKVAALLRRSGRPVLVIANKVDGDSRETDAWTFARLGLGDPWPVSALRVAIFASSACSPSVPPASGA